MYREQRSAFEVLSHNTTLSLCLLLLQKPNVSSVTQTHSSFLPLAILSFGLSLFRFNLNLKYTTKMLSMRGINFTRYLNLSISVSLKNKMLRSFSFSFFFGGKKKKKKIIIFFENLRGSACELF